MCVLFSPLSGDWVRCLLTHVESFLLCFSPKRIIIQPSPVGCLSCLHRRKSVRLFVFFSVVCVCVYGRRRNRGLVLSPVTTD